MEMKTRLLFVPLMLALVASLAACGGGGTSVPSDSVALVNGDKILTATFNGFFTQALAISKANGSEPAPSTPQYTALRSQVVSYLVNFAELKQQAGKLGVSVSDDDVTKFLENLAQTRFSGSMSKLTDALKQQGLDMDTARQEVYYNLLGTKVKDKVTGSAKVTEKDEKAYYDSPSYALTRSVEHILVKKKSLADSIEQQLKNGASFAKLAKKYSKDPGSAAQGGKYTATKGREVPAYDAVAFALKTGQLSRPVDATSSANGGYGWFIIKALAPVPSCSDVQPTIQSTLLQQKKDQLFQKWVADLTKQYKGKVQYQAGYKPPTTTALPTTTTAGATTTG